jgi:ABC-type polysaccharide/polyol phosphate export permease
LKKAFTDALLVAQLDTLRFTRPLYIFLGGLLALPLPILFFAKYIAPNDAEVGPRLVAGSIVFSLGLRVVSGMGVQLNNDRFTYRLNLIRGCPVRPVSYAAGMIMASSARALLSACLVLAFVPIFGMHINLNLWFLPVVVLASVSLAGVALIIGTWAPTWESGSFAAYMAGNFIALVSPVYFPISRLPDWLQPIARLSPYTYAAQSLAAIFAGRGGFGEDLVILAAITTGGLVVGLMGMRWREV